MNAKTIEAIAQRVAYLLKEDHTRSEVVQVPPPRQPIPSRETLTTEEVAACLGCHPQTVLRNAIDWNLRRVGQGKATRWSTHSVRQFLEGFEVKT